MRVAVLGGGFQGCCTALALAGRGVDVTLYERNADLLTRAAAANEGKIHLGYVYGADPTFATAKTMLRGGLAFDRLLRSFLDAEALPAVSSPYVYAVHRDSQLSVDDYARYLAANHDYVRESYTNGAYFGVSLNRPPVRLSQRELEQQFDPSRIVAAFMTPEISVDTPKLNETIRRRISGEPAIEVRNGHRVTAVEDDGDGLRVRSATPDGSRDERFDVVVNALWEGRFSIDAARGLHPNRRWLHRFKHGIRFRLPADVKVPSVTIVLGPFGDVVSYDDGSHFVSWYPSCMTATSDALAPPDWKAVPDEPVHSQLVADSMAAMGDIVPPLREAWPRATDISVRGGVITAWGATDIDDRSSDLHQRHAIGVHSHGRYHTIDTAKFTMAPYFAEVCADRIKPKAGR